MTARGELLYTPGAAAETSRMARYRDQVAQSEGRSFADYAALWAWSTEDLDRFWRSVIDHFDLDIADAAVVLGDRTPPRAAWLPGARLSYARHALRTEMDGPALVGVSQTRDRVELSMPELREAVARARTGLRRLGVGPGDRVVGYLPNIPETVVAFLATASLGAVWASCPPEFGPRAVVDRFAQVEPTVLITVDGYRYGPKDVDRTEAVAAVRAGLPTLRHTVLVDYLPVPVPSPDVVSWAGLLAEPGPLEFTEVDFDHPLYVLFSSGTTGLPKAIVHGHGGILLEHVKALGLHNDVRAGDRFFWQATTGWMVWNYAVSALVLGATMVCFDGHPGRPGPDTLWRLAADERITFFGTSAGHLSGSLDAGLEPAADLDLTALRAVGSTGSPLPADAFRWVHRAVGPGVLLSSVSGGTDICSAFVGGSPLSPVRAGEISAPTLGCAVAALDESGRPVVGEFGELSVLAPMPSMPVAIWGDDPAGTRLTQTYFSRHPGVWSHGDWVIFHEDLSCVITGRSDATLNRGGVRLGTADFYSVLDGVAEVEDSLVVHLDDAGAGELVLLVSTPDDVDEDLLGGRLRTLLRSELSPRHVPDRIVRLRHLPRTLTGKRLEKPVKRILLGADPDSVLSRGSISHPDALDHVSDSRPRGETS